MYTHLLIGLQPSYKGFRNAFVQLWAEKEDNIVIKTSTQSYSTFVAPHLNKLAPVSLNQWLELSMLFGRLWVRAS